MDPWSTLGAAASLFSSKDISYSQVLAAKKALQLLADNKETVLPIVQLCLACADNDPYTIKDLLGENKGLLNALDGKGLTPLIYAIVFHNNDCVDLLLTFNVDCNEPDNLVGWTPVMWATHLDFEDLVERLVSYNADPLKRIGKSMKNAIDLVKSGSKTEEYFKIHGYLKEKSTTPEPDDDFYKGSLGVADITLDENSQGDKRSANTFVNEESVIYDEPLDSTTFNFNTVQSKQYIKFTDDSIRSIMDYVFELPVKHHSKPLYPSSIIFQCMRYAEHKMQSGGMVENLLDLYLTRIRNVIGTKSGVVQFYGIKERKEREKRKKKEKDTTPDPPPVDIVTLSYWMSALNHLYYFLIRDTACDFLHKYPQLLQELINCMQSIVFKLAFTIDARLEPLLEPCMLEYNSVPDTEVLYRSDWKLFKHKSKHQKSSYDEIIDMLYPPSYAEQMKPSPLRVIQTLGALVYVLELHYISDVIKQQCLSVVLYFIGCNLFNKVISNKRYCSRIKGMEIRLNLSYIQDWLRANNLQPFIEEDGDLNTALHWNGDRFPDTLADKAAGFFSNVCRYSGDARNPVDATYYMNSLYTIGEYSLEPIVELTEWLQVMSGIRDQDTLIDIIDTFDVLASSTMVQCIRNYHYEVDEKKFSKSLKKWLKENRHNENETEYNNRGIYYMDDTRHSLNQGQAFPICLPKPLQLLHQYGADFKHVDNRKLLAYQPHVPLQIRDEVETIVDEDSQEREEVENGRYHAGDDEDSEGEEEEAAAAEGHTSSKHSSESFDRNISGAHASDYGHLRSDDVDVWDTHPANSERPDTEETAETVRGGQQTELFRDLTAPVSVARKTWQDEAGSNPWA